MTRHKLVTLVFVRNEGKVLLGMKKRGLGEGRWNGFGGKVEKGETIIDAAKRELFEESGIIAHSLDRVGYMDFGFENDPVHLGIHIFSTSDYSGSPTETEEMRPEWFPEDAIPFDQMWPDDKDWYPVMFAGKKFEAVTLFRGMDDILNFQIKIVDNSSQFLTDDLIEN